MKYTQSSGGMLSGSAAAYIREHASPLHASNNTHLAISGSCLSISRALVSAGAITLSRQSLFAHLLLRKSPGQTRRVLTL